MSVEGRVANVLNARELVINIGRDDGVRRGMKFKVLADTPTEITDPETERVIGVIDREKVRVQATEVTKKRTTNLESWRPSVLATAVRIGELREAGRPGY
jgi:hypothetical protein